MKVILFYSISMLIKKIKRKKINIFIEISDSKQTLFLQCFIEILTLVIWFLQIKKPSFLNSRVICSKLSG